MASPSPHPTSPEAAAAAAEGERGPLKFTLQIMSPSHGVPQPLIIQGLPASVTIKQLKERLRNVLEARPSDQSQRLIHRGRLLARDDETMLNVFGEETVCVYVLRKMLWYCQMRFISALAGNMTRPVVANYPSHHLIM